MARLRLQRVIPALFAAGACGIIASCFVSIDESLLDSVRDDASPENAQDVESDQDSSADVRAERDAEPEGDVSSDRADAGETGDGPLQDAADAKDAGDARDTGLEAQPDVIADRPAEALLDADFVKCSESRECPVVGCIERACSQSLCIGGDLFGGVVTTFSLPAPLACSQDFRNSCIAAVGGSLVALTTTGLVAIDVGNPFHTLRHPIRLESGDFWPLLALSGQRIWAPLAGGTATATMAWLDLPQNGLTDPPPLSFRDVQLQAGNAMDALFAAPNDDVFIHTAVDTVPAFGRFGDGLPTAVPVFSITGNPKSVAVASSANRILLHLMDASGGSYQHSFSLESNVAAGTSSNSGLKPITVAGDDAETALVSSDPTRGFFASSRAGSVAWVIGQLDNTSWKDLYAFWLATTSSGTVVPAGVKLDTFAGQPAHFPLGPITFVDADTIAIVAIGPDLKDAQKTAPLLYIVHRDGKDAPTVTHRFGNLGISDLQDVSIAGDNGYAYLVKGSVVQVFKPSCA